MAKTSWKRAAEALDSVRPGLSTAARQILLGQAYAETYFGNELPDGTNTHNWGSIGGSGDLGYYEWPDTVEGKKVIRKIAKFSTPEKGAERFASVVLDTYKAGKYAETGDLWGYARALWRGGPHNPELGAPSASPGPAYYGGFPPGNPGFAPAGVKQRSKLDDWYRVTAYARMIDGAARVAAKTLGETYEGRIVLPPKPDEDSTDPLPATAIGGAIGDALGSKKKEPETEKMSPEALAEYEARKAEEARILEAERAEQEEGVKKAQAEIARKEAEEAKAKAEADAKAKAKTPGAPGAPPVDQAIPTAAIVVGVLGLAWLLARK